MSNDRCDCYECISRREPRDAATHVDGREAPMEACEMPASSGGAAWAATVEACARAAYDASLTAPRVGARGQALMVSSAQKDGNDEPARTRRPRRDARDHQGDVRVSGGAA